MSVLCSEQRMARYEDNDIILRENPLLDGDHYDVIWKPREKHKAAVYCSRHKSTNVKDTLKSYNDGKAKKESKDKIIDYYQIDEYCKVSDSHKPLDKDLVPRVLKTNTTQLGLPKTSFEEYERRHIGGNGNTERSTLTVQPTLNELSVKCHQVQPNNTRWNVTEHNDTTALQGNFPRDEITLKCCGQNVETIVDTCTCMWCIKGIFYHCTQDSDEILDNPCSCSPVNVACCKRWSMISLLTLVLPCLLCYPITYVGTGLCKSYKESEMNRNRNRAVKRERRERRERET